MPPAKDPTEPVRRQASRYAGVDEGKACTQSSFKVGKKAFLYAGMVGGRYKLMFKLDESLPEADRLVRKDPDSYSVGNGGWFSVKFTAEQPLPTAQWTKWLAESHALAAGGSTSARKKVTRKKTATTSRKTTKKVARKKTTSKKTAARKTARKKSPGRSRG